MNKKKILFVVHRYYPYPGGSEYYVKNMAEECFKRGHEVTVLTGIHQGDQNGVKVTSDATILMKERFDLIIVHGGDVNVQDLVHVNGYELNKHGQKVAYMLIKPSETKICLNGLRHHKYITYSTSTDIDFIKKHNVEYKARRIRHGVNPIDTIVKKPKKIGDRVVYVSAGGFYPHKQMKELFSTFTNYYGSDPNYELHMYGYGVDDPSWVPQPNTKNVKVFVGSSKEDVMKAIAGADAYIMNSSEEGFGLVLIEAMMNKTPWFSRPTAGALDMKNYGSIYGDSTTYSNRDLFPFIESVLENPSLDKFVNDAYEYAMSNHSIKATVDDIEDILYEV